MCCISCVATITNLGTWNLKLHLHPLLILHFKIAAQWRHVIFVNGIVKWQLQGVLTCDMKWMTASKKYRRFRHGKQFDFRKTGMFYQRFLLRHAVNWERAYLNNHKSSEVTEAHLLLHWDVSCRLGAARFRWPSPFRFNFLLSPCFYFFPLSTGQ